MLCNHVHKRICCVLLPLLGKISSENEKKLSQIMFFHRKRRFLFFFSFVFRIDFFLSVSFRYILYFFLVVNDLTDFIGFAIYFFFIVMKRHNRFFELVTSVLSQRDIVKPWVCLLYTSPSPRD